MSALKAAKPAAAGETFIERRSKGRRRVHMAAKIAFGTSVADCTIRDLTDGGARIHAPTVLGLPDEVYLLILSEGLVVRSRRMWADFPAFGLRFLQAEPIETCTRPQCAALKAAWEETRGRQRVLEPAAAE